MIGPVGVECERNHRLPDRHKPVGIDRLEEQQEPARCELLDRMMPVGANGENLLP